MQSTLPKFFTSHYAKYSSFFLNVKHINNIHLTMEPITNFLYYKSIGKVTKCDSFSR